VSDYDVVIVGAGVSGAVLARHLGDAGKRVLVLEAGDRTGRTWDEYQANVRQYQSALIKVPNAPYLTPDDASSPNVLDLRKLQPGGPPDDTGYFVQEGPLPFGSDYLRSVGGTTLHWMGTSLRMLPADFQLRSRYKRGRDWPIAYEEMTPYYERAEREIGVSADVEDQAYLGIKFRPGYVYPMHRIPLSYSDQWMAQNLDGQPITMDGDPYELLVTSTPAGRNSIPNPRYDGGQGYEPVGAAGAAHRGLRCEGNSSCVPICPVQAKFNALKTLARVKEDLVEIRSQCVVTKVLVNDESRKVYGVQYIPFSDGQLDPPTEVVTADLFVLAGNAIENAKLLLASQAANSSGQVGLNLMDHPFMLLWARAPVSVGAWRGPASSAGIEILRDGPFRSKRAAFRVEIANWGWYLAGGPYSDVEDAVHQEGLVGAGLRAALADRVPRQIRIGPEFEQLPDPANNVTINPGYLDALGQPRPVLRWNVDDYTRAGMQAAVEMAQQVFAYLNAENCTKWQESDIDHVTYQGAGYSFMGAGHNCGTHRMGSKSTDSVVDSWSRSWDHENLYVVGCGSMPTIGTSNPTLTMTALVMRALDSIKSDLGLPVP
jgi:choline dehydrogenase-like flavoprotein